MPATARTAKTKPVSRTAPRTPRQERGRARYEAMLDAAEALLATAEVEEIGYYEIVKRARMKAASAYHFFPTKSAIFIALAQRYLAHFVQWSQESPSRSHVRWQDLIANAHQDAVAYYNGHRAAMKLILGAQPFLEVLRDDSTANKTISLQLLERLRTAYELPNIKDAERKFLIAVAISDGIWRASFSAFGRIVPDYAEEAVRATLAYLRTFLPEHLELRANGALQPKAGETRGTRKRARTSAI